MEYRPCQSSGNNRPITASTIDLPLDQEQVSGLKSTVHRLEKELESLRNSQQVLIEEAETEAVSRGCKQVVKEAELKTSTIAAQVHMALKNFCEERDVYFTNVEQEVVRLALGIAARILHRETQIDPLLLAGSVRVALSQLSEGTEVSLRVGTESREMWEEMLRLMPHLPLRPKVIGEDGFGPEECLLVTEVGSVDLGVRSQLTEIERGFFDLLDQRPKSNSLDGGDLSVTRTTDQN